MVLLQDIDAGWNRIKNLASMPRRDVQISVPVFYAAFVEYGTRRMEGRPFLKMTWEEHDDYKQELADLVRYLFVKAGQGKEFGELATAELMKLGAKVVQDVRTMIEIVGAIDTGAMWHSVRANVVAGRDG